MRRAFAGIVLSASLISPLLAQRPAPPPGATASTDDWRVETTVSEMTGESGLTLTLNATTMVDGVVPSLIVRCHERGLEAYIWTGSVLDGSVAGQADVRLRWDTVPPEAESWLRSTNGMSAFAPDPHRFVQLALAAAELRFEFHPHDATPRVAVLRTGGLVRYMSALQTACPSEPQSVRAAAVERDEPYLEAVVEERPERRRSPPARYPEVLRQAGIEGRVLLEVVIDTTGHAEPGSIRVITSTHQLFEGPAREVVQGSLYSPGKIKGRAVRVRVQMPINFSIGRAGP